MSQLGEKVNKLLRRIKDGDKESFQQLHKLTYNHLTVVAMNYLYSSENLKDVLNESYFRVFRYIDSYDTKKDGYNWMCNIVQNVAYKYNKKFNVTVEINKIETHKLFYELDDNIIDNASLLQAIKSLGGEEQELIYLRFWEDLSFAEIAAQKGMKKPTVYKKIRTALKTIEKFLNKE